MPGPVVDAAGQSFVVPEPWQYSFLRAYLGFYNFVIPILDLPLELTKEDLRDPQPEWCADGEQESENMMTSRGYNTGRI
jgi:hypothetical protein